MRAWRLIALAVLAGASGYLIGAVRQAPAAAPAVVVAPSPAAPREIITRPVVSGIDATQIRQIVREELAQAAPVAEAAVERAPVAEDPRAIDRAQAIVDASLAAGVWTEADRTSLRLAMAALSEPQTQQIFGALFPALNAGRVRLTYDGTPL
jgi:(2Fe-2S) ferredoxin